MGVLGERQAVVDTILRLGAALDGQDWHAVRACLADELDTDYSSFRGTPPARLAATEFVRLRQVGLQGLVTQHLSLGHLVTIEADTATCRCDFVIRRWPADVGDARFLHSYGYYRYGLVRIDGAWRIASLSQIVTRSEGDAQLHGALRPTPEALR